MAKLLVIEDCSYCPCLDYPRTGDDPGRKGDKPMCAHKKAIRSRLGPHGGLGKLMLTNKYPRPPRWCPLPTKYYA